MITQEGLNRRQIERSGNSSTGVFLCTCDHEISDVVDVNAIAGRLRASGDCAFVQIEKSLCHPSGLGAMRQRIAESGVSRVIISACSYQSKGMLFERATGEAGIELGLMDLVNIREACAWCHKNDPAGATAKARALTVAAVERMKQSQPYNIWDYRTQKSVMVIGGGPAGMTAAFDLADANIPVVLVDKAPSIGGNAIKLWRVFPTQDCGSCIAFSDTDAMKECRRCMYRSNIGYHPNIDIMTRTEIKEVSGAAGDFHVRVEQTPRYVDPMKCTACRKCEEACPVEVVDDFNMGLTTRKAIYLRSPQAIPKTHVVDRDKCPEGCHKCVDACPFGAVELDEQPIEKQIRVGAIIVSSGFEEWKPEAVQEYGYGINKDVITQLQLARMLDPGGPTGGKILRPSDGVEAKKITMIQCVGSRDNHHEYCSELCCSFALKHANYIRETRDAQVDVCYIDIRTPGPSEVILYRQAREAGVGFIRGKPSRVHEDPETKKLTVRVVDSMLGKPLQVESDLVVLSAALVPTQGTQELAATLNIALNQYGFIGERYSKNMPIDTDIKGIFVAGAARGPKDIATSVSQGSAAAAKALLHIRKEETHKVMSVSQIDKELCIGCEICANVCPYHVISMEPRVPNQVAYVDPTICVGCGQCTAWCPTGAAQLANFQRDQVFAQVETLARESTVRPLVVNFLCKECASAAIDQAGLRRVQYPANIHSVEVPCTGKVGMLDVLKAIQLGADGVMVTGCYKCHYKDGTDKMQSQMVIAREIMNELGLDGDRLEHVLTMISRPELFVEKATEFVERLKKKSGQPAEPVLVGATQR